MRLSLLLALVPAIALADASVPTKTAAERAPGRLEYVGPAEGDPAPSWQFTEYKPGNTVFRTSAGYDVVIRKVLEPAVVNGRHDRYYLVVVSGQDAADLRIFGGDLTPFAFWPPQTGGAVVTVAFGADFKIHVHSIGKSEELVLEPAGQGYLSRKGGDVSAALVASAAPVPLLEVSSRPEACSDYWKIYVSLVGGVPRQALALYGVADPPAMQTSTVEFTGDGGAVVTTRTTDDGTHTRTRKTRYRFDGRVFVDVSKRSAARSK